MNYKNLNELYETEDGIIYLTNSLGEKGDNIEIPEAPYEWYGNLEAESSALLYLVKLKNQYGIMAVNEYDSVTANELFNGNYNAMRKMIRKNAIRLCMDDLIGFGGYMVLVGENTGFSGCDELGIFIPYETEYDVIKGILRKFDDTAYIKSNSIYKPGVDFFNGFACLSRQSYGLHYIKNNMEAQGYVDEIIIGTNKIGGCMKGEAAVRWIMLKEKAKPRFEIFTDGFDILCYLLSMQSFKDFVKANPDFTPDEFSRILIKHGFVDNSDRKLPE